MKGIEFVVIGEISPEAKVKFGILEKKRKEKLIKLVDYRKNIQF